MKNGGSNWQWHNQGNGITNRKGNKRLQQQKINLQSLLSAFQNSALNQPPLSPTKYEHPFGVFMAKAKFRSMIAQVADEKTSDAFIDSGATHYFFRSRSVFIKYYPVAEELVKAATGVTKIFGKGLVHLPVNNDMLVEAYQAPKFSSNILSALILQLNFKELFVESTPDYPSCYFLRKGKFTIFHEFKLHDVLYALEIPIE